MVYETKVGSLKELFGELEGLDADAGVRILGSEARKKIFIFVTRRSGKYAVAIFDAETRAGKLVPGKASSFKEFIDSGSLHKFLTQVTSKPLRAYLY